LAELAGRIGQAVRPFAPTEKPERFTGHITVGRFKPGHHGSLEHLLKRVSILRDRLFGDWLAGSVEIVRSELTSTGALHTPLASYPLALPRSAGESGVGKYFYRA
jgi:2'-5' RNA ligase